MTCPIGLKSVGGQICSYNQARRCSKRFQEVVTYVMQRYPDNQSRRRFMNRADPWVIAHAIAQGGTVVSLEGCAPNTSTKVKIPNVCSHFNVTCINTYQMLRELGAIWTN